MERRQSGEAVVGGVEEPDGKGAVFKLSQAFEDVVAEVELD